MYRARGRHASSGQAKPALSASPEGPWLPPGSGIHIAGLTIVGGLLYVGSELPSASGMSVEPALIDPELPVDMTQPDWDGQGLDRWPSYAALPAPSRAAYLSWLADGRCYPRTPLGYVLLYFYGLERRVLHDLHLDSFTAQEELPVIHEEVQRLIGLYAGHDAFQRHAAPFEALLAALCEPEVTGAAFALRARLGELAAQGQPVPADWALAWLHSHPAYRPGTPATRCPEEFGALFQRRYAARHGEGLVVQPGGKELVFDYRPASSGFAGAPPVLPGIPDVLTLAAPTRELFGLAEECGSELEAYSRFLGRLPGARQSVRAQALLPAELLDLDSGGAGGAVRWALRRLGPQQTALVPAEDFVALLSTPVPARKDVIALAQILGRAGVGIEPDPRLGGPVPTAGMMALFAAPDGPTAAASDAYRAATVLLHLGAASTADGQTPEVAYRRLSEHLERALHLTPGEQARLRAHLEWLLAGEVTLIDLIDHVQAIGATQRAHVAEFLRDVAAADGHITPEEADILARIHWLLGLDRDTAGAEQMGLASYAAVRQAPIQLAYVPHGPAQPVPPPRVIMPHHPSGPFTSPPFGPVPNSSTPYGSAPYTSTPYGPGPYASTPDGPGPYASTPDGSVPSAFTPFGPGSYSSGQEHPIQQDLAGSSPVPHASVPQAVPMGSVFGAPTVPVWGAVARLAETAQVGIMLDSLLAGEEPLPVPAPPPEVTPVAGLDGRHSGLVRALAAVDEPHIGRGQFEILADAWNLLPEGAIDRVNEAAYETVGDPLLDGDDPILVDRRVLGEMLK
ncbi:TerB N-terminal domain-containing protein [Nonomuraea sp. NPDC026600]|uniref:TerB N-terminal domain-containing protein n=1 Tax=Nonomuraea sp. NPDC026600 TaxID=3155363 RepID=UPI00340E486A